MFNNFVICVNAVLPLAIYLVIGALIRKFNVLTVEEVHHMNHMVFVAFFPALMFNNLYSGGAEQSFEPKLIIFALAALAVIVAVDWIAVRRIESEDKKRSAMIQAIYRSNFILMGLPIVMNIYGSGNAGVTAALIMFVVPTYNILAVIILEYYRGGHPTVGTLLLKIIKNPIIIGALLAIFCMVLSIKVPKVLMEVISDMSGATTPIAMILLGAAFNFKSVKESKRDLTIAVVARLLIVPAFGLTAAVLLGFRNIELVSLIAMFAAPCAVSSYTMAEAMGSDGDLAGNCVIFTTPISCITLFGWLFLFKMLGMF